MEGLALGQGDVQCLGAQASCLHFSSNTNILFAFQMEAQKRKMILYKYVGPPELRANPMLTERFLIATPTNALRWAQQQPHKEWIATFVIDEQSRLWLANRRSEHIACARGGQVQAAGELELEVSANGVEVVIATNQSTGFCPRVESWPALERALNATGLPGPPTWTTAFEFRRCDGCGELNVVKDDWFVCSNCDTNLPLDWNIGNS